MVGNLARTHLCSVMSPIQVGLLALISGGSWLEASLLTASVMYGHIFSAATRVTRVSVSWVCRLSVQVVPPVRGWVWGVLYMMNLRLA